MCGEPAAKLGEVDRAPHDPSTQQLEHGDVDGEHQAQDAGVLHREVHDDATVLLAEGPRPPRERMEERRRFVVLLGSGQQGGFFERARQRGLVSIGRKPIALGEELVAREEAGRSGSISGATWPS